jgi:hypothetical protein
VSSSSGRPLVVLTFEGSFRLRASRCFIAPWRQRLAPVLTAPSCAIPSSSISWIFFQPQLAVDSS